MSIRHLFFVFVFLGLFSCHLYEGSREKNKTSKKSLTYNINYKDPFKVKKQKNIKAIEGYSTFSFLNESVIFYYLTNIGSNFNPNYDILFSERGISLNRGVEVAELNHIDFYRIKGSDIEKLNFNKRPLLRNNIFYEKITRIQTVAGFFYFLGINLGMFPPVIVADKKELSPANKVFVFKLSKGRYVKVKISSIYYNELDIKPWNDYGMTYNQNPYIYYGYYNFEWDFIDPPTKEEEPKEEEPKVEEEEEEEEEVEIIGEGTPGKPPPDEREREEIPGIDRIFFPKEGIEVKNPDQSPLEDEREREEMPKVDKVLFPEEEIEPLDKSHDSPPDEREREGTPEEKKEKKEGACTIKKDKK